jgi:hypothetical protein
MHLPKHLDRLTLRLRAYHFRLSEFFSAALGSLGFGQQSLELRVLLLECL